MRSRVGLGIGMAPEALFMSTTKVAVELFSGVAAAMPVPDERNRETIAPTTVIDRATEVANPVTPEWYA